jgi:fibronectin-binding autotransporter adhesin
MSKKRWNLHRPRASKHSVSPRRFHRLPGFELLEEQTLRSLLITVAGDNYNISGSDVTLLEGITGTNTGTSSFTAKITLAAPQTFVSGNGTLNLGAVDTGNLQLLTVDGDGTLHITGVVSGSGGINKTGSGALIVSGANTYEGLTTVSQGVLNVRSNSGLGSPLAGTTVTTGAALQVQSGVTVAERLAISDAGIGFGDGTDTKHGNGLGALRSISGANVWTGGIELVSANANIIGVDLGSSLDISGAISSTQLTVRPLAKAGAGTLRLSGAASNTFRGSTTVIQGTLELNKSAGVLPFQEALIIGDNVGGDNAAVVRLLQNEQIPRIDSFNTAINTITINSSGVLDLNGFSDTVGNIVMVNGATYCADIATGAGTLTLDGASLTVNAFQGSSPASPAATISGKFDLGTFFSGAGGGTTKTFNINNTALASVDADLIINAHISGSADVSLTRTGAGAITFAGNNTYAGPTILNATGVTGIASNTAFGTGLLSVQGTGNILRAVSEPQMLANAFSIDGNFAIRGANNLTFTGPATLTGTRTITILDAPQTTTFAGGIGESIYGSQALSKSGRGTLAITSAATYSGATIINLDGGTISLKDDGTLLNTSAITINEDGRLRIDNSGTMNLSNRLNDATAITLTGGELSVVSAATGFSTETVGPLTLTALSSSTIRSTVNGTGSSTLIINALTQSTGTLQFLGVGADITATGTNRVVFTNTPVALTNGTCRLPACRGRAGWTSPRTPACPKGSPSSGCRRPATPPLSTRPPR